MGKSEQVQGNSAFRDRVQDLLRASILDAAWARAAEVTWSQVRMADLADDVGVSRQTIYNEFGAKDDLVMALFAREMERFLVALQERIDAAASPDEAIRANLVWLLDEMATHSVLGRMVTDARTGSTDGLIPVLTFEAQAIIRPAVETVVELMVARWPALDRSRTAAGTELTVRFLLSHLLAPTDLERDLLVDSISAMSRGLFTFTDQ
jgi:AcrR family transcriptional regulator